MAETDEPQPKKPARSNYPSNTNKEKAGEVVPATKVTSESERAPLEKVISGNAVQRKKSLGSKIAETFAGDDAQSVGQYILFDVVIPATKNLISDMVSQGIERLLFGDARGRIQVDRRVGGRTGYNKMYNGGLSRERDREEPRSRSLSNRARATHDFGEILMETRGEATEVLDRLMLQVEEYDVATVADLYNLVGISGTFQDEKFGWTDLRGSEVVRVRNGYVLRLPRTTDLD